MKLQTVMAFLGALAFVAGFGFAREARAADETVKIGTLAPKSSPWGKVFETWIKAVNEKSSGNLELQFFYNGSQGDEDGMVGKIKSGQLDGAAVTGVGLSKVYKPILALQMPLFTSWSKLDKARDAMKADFENHRLWTKSEIDNLRVVMESKLELLRSSMTIRLGSMLVVGLSLLFAALKLT